MAKNKKPLQDDAGKKIAHPADAIRKKAKKKRLEKVKKERMSNFERKLLEQSPEEIEHEIMALKMDQERKRAHKIEISKVQQDRLTRLELGFQRMKEEIGERDKKRKAEPKGSMHIDFEELKMYRKFSIYYDPVKNPYGAPPNGQMLMYRHPDGSTKREPPPLNPDGTPVGAGGGEEDSDDEDDEDDDDEDEDEDEGMPPLPPGPPPGAASSSS
eukprot:CAMPEP_0195111652 /NCGR_PEP_ID=MMETSP0448-20130528/96717_1 /TAXON_ID=66468 /ORGANISM="Heterocapsa triquestra, Strain CCMP 448" /LENGTH=213 /DNA_ID=CAMNT_0040148451 /DNA_START=35 /DNA_END=673 /DNA_ORIENTATION=+